MKHETARDFSRLSLSLSFPSSSSLFFAHPSLFTAIWLSLPLIFLYHHLRVIHHRLRWCSRSVLPAGRGAAEAAVGLPLATYNMALVDDAAGLALVEPLAAASYILRMLAKENSGQAGRQARSHKKRTQIKGARRRRDPAMPCRWVTPALSSRLSSSFRVSCV